MISKSLILASASEARRTMLERAGVNFEIHASNVDEKVIKQGFKFDQPSDLACKLASEKAFHVSKFHPDAYVVGADQILVCDDKIFDKPVTIDEARQNLMFLRGKSHRLISAVAVVEGEELVWSYDDVATLTMRSFTDDFLNAYLADEGDRVFGSVGCYRIEGPGIQLFTDIEGCHETILGLPLVPLLEKLRELQVLDR